MDSFVTPSNCWDKYQSNFSEFNMKYAVLAATLPLLVATSQAFANESSSTTELSPHSFSANVSLVSDYRFRGFTQTNMRPAIQGGFDYSHSSGFYIGNWNSNVTSDLFPGGNIEMDLYAGYTKDFGGIGLDLGVLYYYYPGTTSAKGGVINNTELYIGLSYGPFSAKYSHGVSDFFGAPNSKNNYYIDVGADFELGNGWGLKAHLGYQKLKNDPAISGYVDYLVGVTKDIDGWVIGASVVGATHRDWYQTDKGRDAGRPGFVLSVARAF